MSADRRKPSPGPSPGKPAATPAPGGPAQEVSAADVQPAEVQPAEVQPAEVQPTEVQPTEVQPTEVQPTDVPAAEVPAAEVPADDAAGRGVAGTETGDAEPRRAESAEGSRSVEGAEDVAEAAEPASRAEPVAASGRPEPLERTESAERAEPAAAGQDSGSAKKRPGLRRPSRRAGIVVAFLCASLGFALAAQLQNNEGESQFANARQTDLVRILDELNSREERLRSEITDLEFRRETINSRAQGSEAALADARRRAIELGILAGTLEAEGSGLIITISEKPGERLPASSMLDTIEELRGAGAEAMQVEGSGGKAVRIGVSTYFADTDNGIDVDGTRLVGPYTITVIGDPGTMEGALRIPGGIVESVRQESGTTMIDQRRTVQVTAVREVREPRFARPAS